MSSIDISGTRERSAKQSVWQSGMLAVAALATFSFILHLFFNNRYGYFRDEFNYIICGNHLAWGYVDQPPLLPLLARISRTLFGDSLRAIRLVPALSNAAVIILTGMITRELGGRRFAIWLAGLSVSSRRSIWLAAIF